MYAAIRPHHAKLNVAWTSFSEKLHAALHYIFTVIWMHSLSVIIQGRTLTVVITEKKVKVLLRVEDFARYQILFPTTGVAKGFRLAQNLFTLSNRFLRLLMLGDILSGPEQARDSACTVLPSVSSLADMLQFAISFRDAVFHLEGFSIRSGFGVHLQDPSLVIRVNSS